MHRQTGPIERGGKPGVSLSGAATGIPLFLATFLGEAMIGGACRWVLTLLVTEVIHFFLPLPLGPEALAWIGAVAPLLNASLALAWPGRGYVWRRRAGVRRPVESELVAIDDALVLLDATGVARRNRLNCFVVDKPLLRAGVRGNILVLDRGLIESESLAAALAHELGHLRSFDGRLGEAVERFRLWRDPLGLPVDDGGGGYSDDGLVVALIWGATRAVVAAAGGGWTYWLLRPLWAAHWRAREYAADAYAAALGEAEDLARHLSDRELLLDRPHPGFPFAVHEHPPIAERIGRLEKMAGIQGSV